MGYCGVYGDYVEGAPSGCPQCSVPTFTYAFFQPSAPLGSPGVFIGPWYVCPKCGGGFSQWEFGLSVGSTVPKLCPWCGLEAGSAPEVSHSSAGKETSPAVCETHHTGHMGETLRGNPGITKGAEESALGGEQGGEASKAEELRFGRIEDHDKSVEGTAEDIGEWVKRVLKDHSMVLVLREKVEY